MVVFSAVPAKTFAVGKAVKKFHAVYQSCRNFSS